MTDTEYTTLDAVATTGGKVTTEVRRRGRPRLENAKQTISIRLEPDIADFLRSTGDGWTQRIQDILRAHVKRQRRLQQRRRRTRKAAR